MNNKYNLKPCPFCGRKATIFPTGSSLFSVHCSSLDCSRDRQNKPKQEAIEAWNKRVSEDE